MNVLIYWSYKSEYLPMNVFIFGAVPVAMRVFTNEYFDLLEL